MPKRKTSSDDLLKRGILEKWHNVSLKEYQGDKRALDHLYTYLEKLDEALVKGFGLYIYGPNGVGKTYLLNALFKEFYKRSVPCRIVSFGGFIETVISPWEDRQKKAKFHESVKKVSILGIEELGKEFRANSGISEIVFDNLFRYRLQRNKPTIVTSNLAPEDLKSIYGDSTASMLRESLYPLFVDGDDWRSKIVNDIKAFIED